MSSKADLPLAYEVRLQDSLTASRALAELGAGGSPSDDGPSPFKSEILGAQYLVNVKNWMLVDSDTANAVNRELLPSLPSHGLFSCPCRTPW